MGTSPAVSRGGRGQVPSRACERCPGATDLLRSPNGPELDASSWPHLLTAVPTGKYAFDT